MHTHKFVWAVDFSENLLLGFTTDLVLVEKWQISLEINVVNSNVETNIMLESNLNVMTYSVNEDII